VGAHVVGRQTLEVEVDSEEVALALQARLPDTNRRRLLPALTAVLDEFDVDGQHLRLGRIEIDLGLLPVGGFEDEVGPRLAAALREELRRALHARDAQGRSGVTRRSPAEARVEALEHYLVQGTLPFWAAHDSAFSCEAGVLALAEQDPRELAALLRRVGQAPRVLERLAAQLGEGALRRLVGVLEPRHAGLIVAYVGSLRAVQQAERIVPLVEPGFSRLMWVLAQAYLVRDAGSTFNRRSFLKSLVAGLSAREGIEYALLLRMLQRALAHARRRLARHASFPADVAELVREIDAGEPDGDLGDDAYEETARRERPASGAARADGASAPAPHEGLTQSPAHAARDASERLVQGIGARERLARERHPDSLRVWRLASRAGAPYARFERLAAWLRSGRRPWRELLRAHPDSAARSLEALASVPAAWRRDLLAGSAPERRRTLESALRGVPPARVAGVLRRLLPGLAQGPLAEAFARHAGRARDRVAFHASALLAALDGHDLDLEAWAGAQPVAEDAPAPEDLSRWSADELRAALIERLRGPEPAGAPRSADLVLALARAHPAAARAFVRALGTAPDLERALVCRVRPEALDELLAAAAPARARMLVALWRSVRRLPPSRRPRLLLAWRGAASLALRAGSVAATPEFIERALRQVFAGEPSPDTRRALRLEWPESTLDEERAAWRTALADGPRRVSGETPPGAAPPRTATPPVELDDAPLAREVLAWLADEPTTEAEDTLADACDDLLARSPEALQPVLRRRLGERRARETWAARLSESALARVVALVEPRRHAALVTAVQVLAEAWSEIAPPGRPALFGRRALWAFVLAFLAETPAAERTLSRLADALGAHLAQGYRAAVPNAADSETLGADWLERARRLARRAGDARLLGVLEREQGRLQARFAGSWRPSRMPSGARERRDPPQPARPRRDARRADEAPGADALYVANAGLVLVGAYLPRFFDMLGLLAPDDDGRRRLRDTEALTRAVHLLQFLADGRTDAPEAHLALNKVLCGATPADVVGASIDLSDDERASAEGLLRALIGHWTIVANTSIAGLRETFLQREGRLEDTSDGWRLTVQRKTLDVLVDQVPWSFSVLRHDFMPRPLYTRW
jgi:hypothetical protein